MIMPCVIFTVLVIFVYMSHSGRFRGVCISLVSIETPFVPDNSIKHLAQFQEEMAQVPWNPLLDKALRDS